MFELIKDAYSFAKNSIKGRNGKADKYLVIFVLTVEFLMIIGVVFYIIFKL